MNKLEILQREIEKRCNLEKDLIWRNNKTIQIVMYRQLFFYLRKILFFNDFTYKDVSIYVKSKGYNSHHSTQIHSEKVIQNYQETNSLYLIPIIEDIYNEVKFLKKTIISTGCVVEDSLKTRLTICLLNDDIISANKINFLLKQLERYNQNQ